MTTISKLNSVDSVNDGDLLPIYSTPNSDTRKASLSVLSTYFQGKLAAGKAQTQYAAPSANGFSIIVQPAVNGADVHVLVTPTGALSGGTITLPANNVAVDKQAVLVTTTAALTGLTFAASGSSINGAPSMLGASCAIEFAYDKLTNAWYCISDADEDTTISVRQFISTAVDGVTSNQAGIEAAVSAAIASASDLYWPAGTYVSDANIPNFHSVKHVGPGVLKRGSDTFVISCKTGTNRLYVSPAGVDTNDGLSSAQPRLLVQSTGDLLYNWPYGNVTWRVELAAGTYPEACTFSKPFPSPNRVVFKGPTVANGVQPTAIMDGTVPGGSGFFFQNLVRAHVESIFFKNYTTADLGTGVIIDTNGELYTKNVWTLNCARGIFATSGSRLRVEAGIIDGNNVAGSIGVSIFSLCTYTVGYAGTAKSILGDTGPAILRCARAGVFAQEGSTGHVDYSYVDANGVGIDIVEKSRCHLLESRVSGSSTGARTRGNSSLYSPSANNNVFTGNTDDLIFGADSIKVDRDQDMRDPRFALRETQAFSTQSATPVTATTYTFEAGELAARGSGFELTIYGSVVGVAGTKNVTVTLGGTTIVNRTIAAASTAYVIKAFFRVRNKSGANAQTFYTQILENGATAVVSANATGAEDMTVAKLLTITHNVANVADTNRIQGVDIEVVH